MKITIVLLSFLLISHYVSAEVRFKDDQMMKQHHNHTANYTHGKWQAGDQAVQDIIIHLIPHSHDDIGWLKTVDSYYYGANMSIQYAGVQYTIDSVIAELATDPLKKFIQVEIGFFYRWWNEQTDDTKTLVKQLVKDGQLEFINGGWCMNDEATPYYEDIIENMAIGHKFLLETFGVVPKVGWHIDPFGHSSAQASIFSQMGFDSFFFARIDYQDKTVRLQNKGMEMVWHPRQDSKEDNYIFTHTNYYHYSAPPSFCFDQACNNDPIMDDPALQYYNVDKRSKDFVDYFKSMATHYRSKNLLHTLGEDFQYMNAHQYYKNIDKLIKYINSHPELGATVRYSTVTDYITAINKEGNTYPTQYDDFFPYADCEHCYWTGYFVSRTAIKGIVRNYGRYFVSARTYLALLKLENKSPFIKTNVDKVLKYTEAFEQAIGVLQHHDAVAGTEQQWVADDYVYMLHKAKLEFEQNILNYVLSEQTYINVGEALVSTDFTTCYWNSTAANCGNSYNLLKSGKTVLVNAYNPTSDRDYIFRVKVPNLESVSVINARNEELQGDLICSNRTDASDCDLYFTGNLKSFSLEHFKIIPGASTSTKIKVIKPTQISQLITAKLALSTVRELKLNAFNKFILKTCDSSGSNCKTDDFHLSYNYYESYGGDGQKSGAYVFRPKHAKSLKTKSYSQFQKRRAFIGTVVSIVQLTGTETDTAVRFYTRTSQTLNWDQVVEVETLLNGIKIKRTGKEVVMNVKTNIKNVKTFETDANGLEMQERIVDYRPTWVLKVNEKVSGNYYPINAMITIKEKDGKKLTVVVDRSLGGTSVKEGNLQVMLNRATKYDDARGVGEPINEKEPWDVKKPLSQKIVTHLVFSSDKDLPDLPRQTQLHVDLFPLVYYSKTSDNQPTSFREDNSASLIDSNSVPYMTKLYYKIWNNENQYLFRVHNMNERVSANYVLKQGSSNVVEQTLTANQNLADWVSQRLTWKQTNKTFTDEFDELSRKHNRITEALLTDLSITAKPMQIKTFTFNSTN